MLHTV